MGLAWSFKDPARISSEITLRLRNGTLAAFRLPLVNPPDTLTQTLDQYYDPDLGAWVDEARTRFYYDAASRLEQDITENFDGTVWSYDSLNAYAYDAGGDMVVNTVRRWSLSTDWSDNVRFLHAYDAAGNDTLTVTQGFWAAAWNNMQRTQTTYDANGNEVLALNQRLEGGAWVDDSRIQSAYNPASRTLTRTTQWSNFGVWENQIRSVYHYGMSYLDSIVDQSWTGSIWASSEKFVYTIRNPGLIQNVTILQMSSSGTWENYVYATMSYQASRRTELLYNLWNGQSWDAVFRIRYSYGLPQPVARRRGAGRIPAGTARRLSGFDARGRLLDARAIFHGPASGRQNP